jgi:hypothetical protein
MAFQVSPGVVVQERDLSSIIPAVSTTIGGFAGHFEWGPVNTIVTVDSENNLVSLFGEPKASNYKEWFTAANFLGYGNNLKVVRTAGSTALNSAGPSAANLTHSIIHSDDDVSSSIASVGASAAAGNWHWHGKYPGSKGNGLKVVWHDGGATVGASAAGMPDSGQGVSAGNYNAWAYASSFQTKMPFTTGWAETLAGKDTVYDGVNIAVIDEDGYFSGTKNTVLEVFDGVSKASNAKKDDGTVNFYRTVINDSSKYVYATQHPQTSGTSADFDLYGVSGGSKRWGAELDANGGTFDVYYGGSADKGYATSLTGGTGEFSGTVTASGGTASYGLFSDADTVDVSILLGGNADATLAGALVDLCDSRKDCVVFLSPEEADCLASDTPLVQSDQESNVLDFRNTQLNKSSSYAFLDSGWKYQYDRFADRYRWVPLNGDVAGITVRSDENSETWFSPAGFNRGQVRGVAKLAFNPSKTNRDNLYRDQVNPVVSFPGEGTVLFGDKTLLAKPSAFDRLNVRRLFIVLEKAISTSAKYQLFEQNDEFTRSHFRTLIEPFLRDVQARRGIQEFKVICDTSNNTAAVIDRNEFVADIFIKPTKSINFITLSFVATAQGVDFTEIGS